MSVWSQGFADPRFGNVVIVRPMRDYSSKEIAFYNRLFSIPSVFTPGLDTKVRVGLGDAENFWHRITSKFTSVFLLLSHMNPVYVSV